MVFWIIFHLHHNFCVKFGNSDHSEYLLRGSRYGQRTFRGWGETTTTLHKEDVHGEIKRNTIISLQADKFFIMSTEFDKNISDWRYDCSDRKNGFEFFMRHVKWPKIAVKKCLNLIFKVNFQRQKSSESF